METAVYSKNWIPRAEFFWLIRGKERPKKAVVSGFRSDVRQRMFIDQGEYIRFLSREFWIDQMHVNSLARYAAFIFGVVGYLFLTIPTLDIAQAVLRDVFRF